MTVRQRVLESVAATIADYRADEVPPPSAEHVDRWAHQFSEGAQVALLRELDHVLKQTYFARARVIEFFATQIANKKLSGDQPCEFWRSTYFLSIQQNGNSQAEIRKLFGKTLRSQCGLDIDRCGEAGDAFVYLDDALFTGLRIGDDLSSWIAESAPSKGVVHVLVMAAHRFGEWKCQARLEKEARAAGKDLTFHFWAALRIENRRSFSYTSEVLWPSMLPDDPALEAYVAAEERYPFEARKPGGKPALQLFSSEAGRQLLEREFLLAGMRIRSFSQKPSPSLRPLGFGPFGLGFGSLIVTYRNCPNNTPLALWWGDPSADQSHPFSKWYPLLPRKTYAREFDFDAFDA